MNLDQLKVLMNTNSQMGIRSIFTYLVITLVLTSIVFVIYRMTYSGVAYSNNFNVSIVLTGLITAMIMMVIGNNLALSLGMVGALSIVRFRAAIKEPKDISFLFWSIAIGLSAGTGAILIAICGTFFIAGTIIVYQLGFGKQQQAYLLIIKGGLFDGSEVEECIKEHTKKFRLRMKNTQKKSMEAIYEVRLKKSGDALIDLLYKTNEVEQVNIITFDGHLNE